MQKNNPDETVLLDAYLADRKHYVQFGKDLAKILIQISSTEQLSDLQNHLLILSLAHQSEKTPTHIKAILSQAVTCVYEHLKENG